MAKPNKAFTRQKLESGEIIRFGVPRFCGLRKPLGGSPRKEVMKENELPQFRCGMCGEVLGIMDFRESDEGFYVRVMPCTKCRPTKRAPDARESGAKSIIQIKKVCKARAPLTQTVGAT